MKLYNEGDIKLTEDGDLFLEDDLYIIYDVDYIKQQICNRIKTMSPDWFYDNIGADMEQLLGQPNTKDTAVKGIDLIRDALSGDGFIDKDSVYIKPIPVNNETIAYFVMIQIEGADKPLTFQVDIALSAGINIRGV